MKSEATRQTGDKIVRKHSRASSVDRREIFQKYINIDNEHAENIKLFENDSSELKQEGNNVMTKTGQKELRVVQLRGVSSRKLGVIIAKVQLRDLNCAGYQVIYFLEGGTAKRYYKSFLALPLKFVTFIPSLALDFCLFDLNCKLYLIFWGGLEFQYFQSIRITDYLISLTRNYE